MTKENLFSRAGRPTADQSSATPGPAVILAAHGSRRRIQAGTTVETHARRLQAYYDVHEVAVAFRQGEPSFSEVMDSIASREVTVVPFFSSVGYFSQTVLPRELSLNRHYAQLQVLITDPVGTHPQIPDLVERRMREIFHRFQLTPERAALLIVGHGTPRHATSTSSTLKLAEHLEKTGPCPNVHPAFLDEPPQLEEVFQDLTQDEIVIVPFFMGESYHVLHDIPRRLGLVEPACDQLPAESTHAGRRVIIDQAVGLHPGLTAVVAELVGCSSRGRSGRIS